MLIPVLRKKTLHETTIIIALLVVMAVVSYLLDMTIDNYTQSNTDANSQLSKTITEFTTLQQKHAFIINNAALYEEVSKKQADGKLAISRQAMFEKFNQYRNQFDLINLHLGVSPVQEVKNDKLKRQYSKLTFSEVNAELDVLYDENVYALLSAMQHELSGMCMVTRLTMSLPHPLDIGILKTISEKGAFPFIKTTIKFNWYSLSPVEASEASVDAKTKKK